MTEDPIIIELESSQLHVGTFSHKGDHSRGRSSYVMLGVRPITPKVKIDAKFEHTPDCVQFTLKDDSSTIVGSLIEVTKDLARCTPYSLFVSSNKDEKTYKPDSVGTDLGHLHIYMDSNENVVIIPSSPETTSLCVSITEDD